MTFHCGYGDEQTKLQIFSRWIELPNKVSCNTNSKVKNKYTQNKKYGLVLQPFHRQIASFS